MNRPSTQRTETYQDINGFRSQLIELTTTLDAAARTLDDPDRTVGLEGLSRRLHTDQLRILFLGEFKRGKSTLINAMLGKKILPAWAIPTTAIICEVRWGETPRAFVFHTEAPDQAIPVDVDNLESFITIDEEDETRLNPYQRAVVEWPLELCRNGVECLDSPGLNDQENREAITISSIQAADVLCFVIDCTMALSMSERTFLQTQAILPGGKDIFFVGNKINIVEDEERERVRRSITRRLTDLFGESPRLFFVNARGALDARMSNDSAAFSASGLGALEAKLERYLSDEPGRRRIAQIARELETTATDLRVLADTRLRMLTVSQEELRRRFDRQMEPLASLEKYRDVVDKKIQNFIVGIEKSLVDGATNSLRHLADQVPGWAKEYTPTGKVNINVFKMKQKVVSLVAEVGEYLAGMLQVEFARWHAEEALPLIERQLEQLYREIDPWIGDFMAELNEIRYELTLPPGVEVEVDAGSIRGKERVLAGAAGLIVSGIGGAVEGTVFGFKGMARSILPSIITVVGLSLLNFGPWTIVTSLFTLSTLRAQVQLGKTNIQIKEKVAAELSRQIRDSARARARDFGQAVREQLEEKVRDAIHAQLEGNINDLRREVEFALSEREASEQQVAERDQALRALIDQLTQTGRSAREIFDETARI